MKVTVLAIICILISGFNCQTTTTPAPTRAPCPPLNSTAAFQTECLNRHNYYRSCNNTLSPYSPLVTNNSLVDYAATRCSRSSSYDGLNGWHYGLASGIGENIFWGWSSGSGSGYIWTGNEAVDLWYSEKKYYDCSNPGFSGTTGHYTQVVWKSSTQLGCARCGCWNSNHTRFEVYIVCNYYPAGNYIGEFATNVICC